ncbi:hypothetical protein IFM89_007724 [Coptis chinensis]|uniref:Metal-nicotianamine transporter YSL7 n=1 Tax=Coptis chinensis TaxID=261450 RepID=A0A835MHK9_9MAGN|nr:hypothetical protein IFM89_007724 [Coptis chinensis]
MACVRKPGEAEEEQRVEKIEDGKERHGEEALSEEQIFEEKEEVLPWRGQLSFRAIFVSLVLGFVFSFIVMKLNVTTGIIPSLNAAAGLLGFFLVKMWISVLSVFGIESKKFTRQENTVIQTCVVASSGIAFSSQLIPCDWHETGGYASYILGMSERIAAQSGTRDTPDNVKALKLPWMMIMILDYKLTYPSGTATANLINSFHTPKGAKLAGKKVKNLAKWFAASFSFSFFQWFFAASEGCGFSNFPTFGLQAFKQRFYFDFSSTYVGVGMLCPYSINISMLFGAIVSWGIMWPLIEKKKGSWYSAELSSGNLGSIQGYRVFIAIAIILGDGLFHFVHVFTRVIYDLCKASWNNSNDSSSVNPVSGDRDYKTTAMSYDDERRTQYFKKDQIPLSYALIGYISLALISTMVVPIIFHQLKRYQILVIYIIAPVLAFCNSYGCGLTDWSLASSYGKIAIIVLAAWVGDNGGVIAGLAACGVMMSIVSTASDLMQDFKTGYLTLASPRSMFCSQIIGTLIGCLTAPVVFWIFFYKAYPDLGLKNSAYPAPFGEVYRGIALIGVEGTSALPKYCLHLCLGFFIGAIVLNAIQELLVHNKCRAANLLKFVWEKKNKAEAEAYVPATASGLICGDSLWGMPSAILSLVNVKPPLCMKFLSFADNRRVDQFLEG